jgi:hypothetical protein
LRTSGLMLSVSGAFPPLICSSADLTSICVGVGRCRFIFRSYSVFSPETPSFCTSYPTFLLRISEKYSLYLINCSCVDKIFPLSFLTYLFLLLLRNQYYEKKLRLFNTSSSVIKSFVFER